MSPSQLFRRSKCVLTTQRLAALLFAVALAFILAAPARPIEAAAPGTKSLEKPSSNAAASSQTLPPADPAAAQTSVITWRAQDNPRVISGTYTIPADTKVVMEPGVVVQFDQGSTLQVDGELVGQGTAASRIQLRTAGDYSASISVTGTLNLSYTDVATMISPASGNATLIFADCTFKKYGYIWTHLGYTYKSLSYIQLDRCKFESSSRELPIHTFMTVDSATLVMRDVSFTGGAYARIAYSYVYLDRITSDGANQFGLQLRLDGPVYLDNVTVMNTDTGLDLGGGYSPSNYFLGPNVKLQGTKYPINLGGSGLLPGSTIPTSGNVNNAIRADSGGPGAFWAKFAVPYHLYGLPGTSISGTTIEPGVNVKVAPQTTIHAEGYGIRGTADQPIIFDRLDPAQYWFGMGFQDQGSIVEHTIIEGSQGGVQTASNSHSYVYLNDVILRNNETGSGGGIYAIGTQFINNGIGYTTTGGLTAIRGFLDGGPASPNSFVGNGRAVISTGRDSISARYNWWNSPTGPSTYPNGTGDPAPGADVVPFVTTKPDYTSDRPPVIRFHKPFHTYKPGSKVTLSWESSDDFGIVAHRVLFSDAGASNHKLVAELPGDQRAYEWTVPDIGYQGSGPDAYVRIVAVDSKGHERFDDAEIVIPSSDATDASVTFTTDLAGKTFKTGDKIPVEYTYSYGLYYAVKEEYLLIGGEGLVSGRKFVSTDSARVAIRVSGNGNRELWFYSPEFKIRPDSRLGDQPPVVTLTGPQAWTAFASGDVIPVTWTASDDEAVRSFNLEVSYDGGVSWTMIARNLPPTTNSYDIRTAPGTGHADIRVRVTAFDRRFQGSSAGADRSYSTSGAAQNVRPTVTLSGPGTESQFNLGSPVTLTAEASDRDGTVARVDFYAGNTLIGTSASAPYRFSWTNAPAGYHALTAVATDDDGEITKSAPVNVIIHAEPPAPGATTGAVWAAGYDGPSHRGDGVLEMALDAQGNVYVVGDSIGIGTEIDMAAVKYDSQGRQLWAVRYVGPGHDIPYDIGVDAKGNVYVTGQTWRGYNFAGGTEQDIVTLKYSPDGELLWTRYYTGTRAKSSQDTPSEMEVDSEGNVYIAGMTYRGTSSGYLIGMSVLLKYDTNGNQAWVSTYDTPGENGSAARRLTIGPSGHIYVTGTVRGAVVTTDTTDTDIFTTKYDAAGNIIWRSHFDSPNNGNDFDGVTDLKVDSQGNVYLGGSHRPVSGEGANFLNIKYNPDGTLAWSRTTDVSYAEGTSEIAVDSAGNVFLVGAAEFRHNGGLANDDAVTVKYDANGNHLWTRSYTGRWADGSYTDDSAGNVLVDAAGNAYVGIETRDEAGKYVMGLLKYTPDGTESVRIFRGPNATGDDSLYDMAFDGAGDLYLAGYSFVPAQGANFLVMKIAPGEGLITPMITWDNPADVTYGTVLGDTQLNATANVPGTFEYKPAAGTVLTTGYNYLSVKFTPADTTRYRTTTKGVTLLVKKATAGITLGNLTQTYNGTAKRITIVTNPPDLNATVTYSQNGKVVATTYGTNGTNGYGPINVGSYDVNVTINSIYYEGTASGVLVISDKQAPVVTWNNPADLTYGVALSGAQLNATANVPGTFQYTPAAGTVLNSGTHQLSVTFTPTDTDNYSPVSKTVTLIVRKATAGVTLGNLAQAYDGTAKVPSIVTDPAGINYTLAYTQNGVDVAAPVNAGAYNVTATIDNLNYQGSITGVLVINKATPTITWNEPARIVYGTALGNTQLNATADVPGTFQYSPPAGTVPTVGSHQLSVTFTPTDTANYTTATKSVQLSVDSVPAPALSFASETYSANESAGHVAITVQRTGDVSDAVTVNYATSDNAGLNECSTFSGVASSRCDYATSIGTLRLAAGETSQTIYIPSVDDGYGEGTETFTVTLSNPRGATLGTTAAATIMMMDNDSAGAANPLDQTAFFVRQHYIDFLGREPDAVGLQGWQDVLTNCGKTIAQPCDRVEVSAGFFRSEEFQSRGYFVYRFYSAVGRIPLYEQFMPDFAKVSGFLSAQQLEENKAAFVQEFMARPEFRNRYDSLSDPVAYVEALLNTVGLPNHPGKDGWVTGLASGTLTRAQVLRQLVESGEVYTKYYNEAFVIMQYFGYLRRSADISYLQWIETMNQTGGDYRIMINGFLNSAEYRRRFGQ
jgi:hypothetical protein